MLLMHQLMLLTSILNIIQNFKAATIENMAASLLANVWTFLTFLTMSYWASIRPITEKTYNKKHINKPLNIIFLNKSIKSILLNKTI